MKKLFKNITSLGLSQILFLAGVFSLPLRIQSLIWDASAWQLGFFNSYAAYFIHISEILFLSSFVLFGVTFFTSRKELDFEFSSLRRFIWPVLLILGVSAVMTLFTSDPVLALLQLWQLIIFVAVAGLIGAGFIDRFLVIKIFVISLFLQAVLAIGQFFAGGDLGLQILGESNFSTETLNVAKIVTESEVFVRGMGTLAHANILGGLLAIGLLFLAAYPRKNIASYIFGVVLLMGLFFTFSRGALLAFFSGLLLLTAFQPRRRIISTLAAGLIFLSLALIWYEPFIVRVQQMKETVTVRNEFMSDKAISPELPRLLTLPRDDIQRRMEQIQQALEIASTNPLGVGAGHYSNALSGLKPDLPDYALQPVHNFFILKLAEESAVSAVAFLVLLTAFAWWAFSKKKYEALAVLVGLFILAQLDHYLATSLAGQGLLWLTIGFVLAEVAGTPSITQVGFSRKRVNKI